jgi:hypothetical protein
LKARHSLSRPKLWAIGIPFVAAAIYIFTSLLLPWVWDGPYCCEQRGFAVAVSNIIYGAPLGTMRSDVLAYFLLHLYEPLGQTLAALTEAIPVRSELLPIFLQLTTDDGNGIGYPLFATAAFRLFGLYSWAPLFTMFLLMTVAAAAFLWRFGHRMASVVTVYFVALTIMLFTSIVWDPIYRSQVESASIRYFSLLAVIPVFHIILHLLDPPVADPAIRRRGYALLGIQTALLAFAILVRGSAASLLGAIGTVWLFLVWRRDRLAPLLRDAVLIGSVGATLIAALIYVMPEEYRIEGRVGTVFWHRLVVSLTINPNFPFPGLTEMFDDCAKHGEGLHRTTGDANAGCIWADYQRKHHLPVDASPYSRAYEAVLAKQFFAIVRAFPHAMFDTFFYYKSLKIYRSLRLVLITNFADGLNSAGVTPGYHFFPYPGSAIALLVVALTVGFAHVLTSGWMWPLAIGRAGGVALWALLWTLPPYFVAWANPPTIADLILYVIFCSALALAMVPGIGRWAVRGLRVTVGHQA